MALDVFSGGPHPIWVVSHCSDTNIAIPTQQASDNPAHVVVVNSKPSNIPFAVRDVLGAPTDRTGAALSRQHGLVLSNREAVDPEIALS